MLTIVLAVTACTARRVPKGQMMLKKVVIKCKTPGVSKDDMYGYVKQKPNRKLLGLNTPHLLKRKTVGRHGLLTNGAGFPFYLYIYNSVNPKREVKRQQRRDDRYDLKKARWLNRYNRRKAKAMRKGRPYADEPKIPRKHRTIGEFLLDIGEPPVLYDSTKTNRSVQQMELYLNNKGYFHSTVRDTLVYPWYQRVTGRKRKAIAVYIVEPATPYTIDSITWEIRDPNLVYDILADTSGPNGTLLKHGNNYDVDVFEDERTRITRSLRNNGYFLFSKDYIRYEIDSTKGNHTLNVIVIVNQQQVSTSDSTWVGVNHQRFYIRHVTVKSMFTQVPTKADNSEYDTTMYADIAFLRNTGSVKGVPLESVLRYKPELLSTRIIFRPSNLYSQNAYEETFRQLTSLRVLRQVVIDPVIVPGTDKIDVTIRMYPLPQQSFTAQVEGTNTGGNLGIGGSFGFQNNNVFHGAELLEFRVKGGTEAQQPIAGSQTSPSSQLAFNTIEAGAEASIYFPREFFPFNYLLSKNTREEERKSQERRTVFTTSFNYQRRIDYDRSIGNLAYGYTFRYKKFSRFSIYPAELNVVKVTPREGLQQLLQNSDPLLRYRFTDHLVPDSRITWVYNTQTPDDKQRTIHFLKIDLEQSGNLMYYGIFKPSNIDPDSQGSYRIGGIPFSQYFRFLVDYRWHRRIGNHEELVIRGAVGAGFPGKNYPTLPLEKSFYGGGTNGIRAWEARTLGPGSYVVPADQKYAQFGDVQVEYNVELRFRITKTLGGALFADGGNIWLLRDDPDREGENFDFSRFFADLAFGPGVGLRYDLSFFVVRLDWAFKLRDPSYPYGERWYIPGQRKLSSNLNFGIGYPF